MKDPLGPASIDAVTVPRWWKAFVLGWLLALFVVAGIVIRHGFTVRRLVASLACLALLAGLYLWLTLQRALGPADLTAHGLAPPLVRARLLLIAGMALLVIVLTLLIPHVGMWWLFMHPVVAAGLALPAPLATAATMSLLAIALGAGWTVRSRSAPALVAFGAGAMAIRQLPSRYPAGPRTRARAVRRERRASTVRARPHIALNLSMIVLRAARGVATSRPDVRFSRCDGGYRQLSLRGELAAARELLSAAGIASDIEHSGGSVPPALDGLLAWAVREGVTNVIRHSRARVRSVWAAWTPK
jgi:two-component system sensor histidine kinase DesK